MGNMTEGSASEGAFGPDLAIADIFEKYRPQVSLSVTVPVHESIVNQQFLESHGELAGLRCFKYGAVTGLTHAWFSRMVHRQKFARSVYEIVVETHAGEDVFAAPGDSGSLVFVETNNRNYLAGILSEKYDIPTSLDAIASYLVDAVFSWPDFSEELVKERIQNECSLLIDPTYEVEGDE